MLYNFLIRRITQIICIYVGISIFTKEIGKFPIVISQDFPII